MVKKSFKNSFVFTTLPTGSVTVSLRVTFVAVSGSRCNATDIGCERDLSVTYNIAFMDSEGLTTAPLIIVFSCKNWPAKEPAHMADITIPATNNTPPAIRIM